MASGREEMSWCDLAAILAIAQICGPSSEKHVAEDRHRRTALGDIIEAVGLGCRTGQLQCSSGDGERGTAHARPLSKVPINVLRTSNW